MEPQGDVLLEMAGSVDTWEKKLQDPTATPILLPFEFLKAITCDFSAERELGRGGYGVVYEGVLPSGQIIAVKKLFDLHRLEDEIFQKEVRSLIGIKHKNVVRFVGYCAKSSWEAIDLQGSGNYIFAETRERLLCFEHICNKSLDKYISDESSGLEWNTRCEIIRGICAGLHYLHEKCHIVHLDLKPENILMDATMVPKIADFGLSRIFGDKQSQIITVNRPGTRGYMAPEYIMQGIVSIKADMYTLGVIIIEILTGSRNFPLHFSGDNSSDASFQYFKEKVLETWRRRLQKSQGDTMLEQVRVCIELGTECVEHNPDNRPVTKHMIDRLNEVSIMDASIKTSVSSTSAIVQAGEASDALQQGDTRSEIICSREEGLEEHHVALANVYENIVAEKTKSEMFISVWQVRLIILMLVMILALFGLIGAYAAGSYWEVSTSIYAMALAGAVLVYVVIHAVFFTLDHQKDQQEDEEDRLLEKSRKLVLLLGILVATISYQDVLTPPGGFVLQDNELGHHAGDPVLLYNFASLYNAFFYCNSVSLMLSSASIILLADPILYRPAIRNNARSVYTAVDLLCLIGAFAAGSTHLKTSIYIFSLVAVVLVVAVEAAVVFLLRELDKHFFPDAKKLS